MTDTGEPIETGPAAPLVTLADIRAAAERISDVAVRTPLLPCLHIDDDATGAPAAERELRVKPENLQPTGAFKLRGAYNAVASLTPEERARGVIAVSSGNHAQAVAYAAARLGCHVTIAIPDNAPGLKIHATRALGADIVLVPVAERDSRFQKMIEQGEGVPVPPFDDARVIAGQGTVGLEIAADWPEVDTVLVPVSGGGLLSGVAVAVKELLPHVKVVGVEPALAGDAAESFRRGERTAWDPHETARTIADGLRTAAVGALPWQHIRRYVDDIVTVSEGEIAAAVRVLGRRARIIAEPSGAVATAAYLFHGAQLPPGRNHVAVVSGGNTDPAQFAGLLNA